MTQPLSLRLRATRQKKQIDAVTLIVVWTVALMLLPGNLVVGALGAAGSPAQLLGLGAGVWWLGVRLERARTVSAPSQPIRTVMLIFVVAVVTSYVVAASRPIDAVELRAADRGLLLAFSWLGLLLLTTDGITSRTRLDTVLRGLVLMAGAVALLGIVQFITGTAFVDRISIPGLTANQTLTSVYARNGFVRVAGTSTHPIEFGVMLSMVLPLALHYALSDTHRHFMVRWSPVLAIAIAIPVTISRSALLGVLIVLAVVLPTWTKQRRRRAYVVIVGIVVLVYVAVPGLLGTLVRLFTGVSNDDSALSRTDSYDLAWQFIQRSPLFGRGVSTFLPSYRILDNQYLGLTIETGFFGVLAFIALLVTGLVVGAKLSSSGLSAEVAGLARALVATIAAASCAYATFDGFGFQQVSGLTFFALGCIGALHRIVTRQRGSAPLAIEEGGAI